VSSAWTWCVPSKDLRPIILATARCKRACVISDWIEGVPTDEIERRYTTQIYAAPFNYGDIRNIADTTRFHLRSARQIVSMLLISAPAFEQEIDNLLMQLEAGLPADSLDILMLPIALHRGDYLGLRSAGIRTREQLWQTSPAVLEAILGRSISERLGVLRPTEPQLIKPAAESAA
jgi:helicase